MVVSHLDRTGGSAPTDSHLPVGGLSIELEILERAALNVCQGKMPWDLFNTFGQLCGNADNFTAPIRGLDIARQATDPRDKDLCAHGVVPYDALSQCPVVQLPVVSCYFV